MALEPVGLHGLVMNLMEKFRGLLLVYKQGGRSNSGNFTYPVAFSNVCSISIQKIGFHWAYNPRVTSYSNTVLCWNYTDQADDIRNIDSFVLAVGY